MNDAYNPKLLINSIDGSKKISTILLEELNTCDEFFFSVAFLTDSGYWVFHELFKKLESKNIKESVSTIYVGGGTPSFVDANYVKQIIEVVKSNYYIQKNAEIKKCKDAKQLKELKKEKMSYFTKTDKALKEAAEFCDSLAFAFLFC